MRIDYDTICKMAEELGCRRTDLVALAPKNDPFYVGVHSRRVAAEWFADLWTRLEFKSGSHSRRIHYVLFSRERGILKPTKELYLNTHDDWGFLLGAGLGARYLRLIPEGSLADHRNDPPLIYAYERIHNLPSCDVAGKYGFALARDIDRELRIPWINVNELRVPQPYLVEVWVEKSTQNDILVPLARRLGFNLQTGAGETSEILARDAISRAIEDRRPMRILYISDFDPGGRSMPVALARKIEFWIRELGLDLDITLDPILLTPEQCAHYRLPRTPLKETERRAAKFEERFGEGATELDALEALHPGEIARIVEREVGRYLDPGLSSRVSAANSKLNSIVKAAEARVLESFDISSLEDRFSALVDNFEKDAKILEEETDEACSEIAAELADEMPSLDGIEIPKPRPANPPTSPLFDSRRSYLDQIDHYRFWQGRSDRKNCAEGAA
jgi:hypothetical protein